MSRSDRPGLSNGSTRRALTAAEAKLAFMSGTSSTILKRSAEAEAGAAAMLLRPGRGRESTGSDQSPRGASRACRQAGWWQGRSAESG
eukprot:CAMPEP_0202070860 /NCGR_PEP_ID=MMETSP0964-20121228/1433_1 /ASSEMBLY_ACC=CAM_ASM_000500 /TAXON_ID=4773 /ORGANISM="Schizochytrium aggregatum, Strain ATCC28209" /LENGTH=87 /DNA_ID=CAMNT_0048637775 /DNA_START=535 /DNA_END=794 /DNA_ORIENTATION=+